MTSTFWLGANIIFDLETGKTTRVVMLVWRVEDASVFATEREGLNYLSFVRTRSTDIEWFLDGPTPKRPLGYVLRGVQTKP
jgi:hypothetical protein